MITIMTDSGSDMKQGETKAVVLPLKVSFGTEQYLDGVTIDTDDFYEKLEHAEELPKTGQVTPFEYEEAFQQEVDAGNTVICITLSSKLSGTYQSACIAAREFGENEVYVIDSMNVTFGQKALVCDALRLVEAGLRADQIVKILEAEKQKIHVVAVVDTLEYLKKGGRVSAAAAFVGGVLSIKPVVRVNDGGVDVCGKARGSRQSDNYLNAEIQNAGGIDFTKPYFIGYTGVERAQLDRYVEDNRDIWEDDASVLPTVQIGAAIGTHVGPGAFGVAFFAN